MVVTDIVIDEAPLQLVLAYSDKGIVRQIPLSVTLRTPGYDEHLATGFLFNEGIIQSAKDIIQIQYLSNDASVLLITLRNGLAPDISGQQRNFASTASCGFCGRAGMMELPHGKMADKSITFSAEIIMKLPSLVLSSQGLFSITGGAHATALIDINGNLLHIAEDAGRHNALDKLVGAMLLKNALPLHSHLIVCSGRIGYELVQKSAMAGVLVLCAVGAPTSLAIELAEAYGITLVGFLKNSSFNIYTCPHRIPGYETKKSVK